MVCSNKIWNRVMLNDEGNAGERWKQQWIQLAKKQLCTCSTLLLFISLPLFWKTTMWNFQKLLSSMFYGGNVVRVIVHFFFTAAHFHLALVAASISHCFTTTTKFSCCSPNKKMSPLFFYLLLYISVTLFLDDFRWQHGLHYNHPFQFDQLHAPIRTALS